MKNTFLITPILFALLVSTVSGISQAQNVGPHAAAKAASGNGQALWGQYVASLRGSGQQGVAVLEQISSVGLPRTASNVTTIRNALASNAGMDEKVGLVRLLGRQFSLDNATGMNQFIVSDLRAAANSQDNGLARSATLVFTRLGYQPGFDDMIASAKSRGLVDTDTFFGEYSHALPFASGADQERIAEILRAGNNDYAAQIAAMSVNQAWVVSALSSNTKASLAQLLDSSEPSFSQAIGQFDFVEAVRYSAWLHALATLRASAFNKQGAELIFSKLNDPAIDPRKIMAYMASEFGQSLVTQIGSKDRFIPLLQRIRLHSSQVPQNADMRAIVAQVSAMLT